MSTLTVELDKYVPEDWEKPPFPTAESEAQSLIDDNLPAGLRTGITYVVTGQRITYAGPFESLAKLAREFSGILELRIIDNADGSQTPW